MAILIYNPKQIWKIASGFVCGVGASICIAIFTMLGVHSGAFAGETAAPSISDVRLEMRAKTPKLDLKPVTEPAYTYRALLSKVYDADTWKADVDLGFNTWRHDEALRLYGLDAPEIKRSKAKGVSSEDVKLGFECRDKMLEFLGQNPNHFARTAKYIDISPPVPVVVQTIKDKQGKYGRMLAIIHKDGVNLNEKLLQSGCAKRMGS